MMNILRNPYCNRRFGPVPVVRCSKLVIALCTLICMALAPAPSSAEYATELWSSASFASPRGISVNMADGSTWVANRGANEVVHLSSEGATLWSGTGFNQPFHVSANASDGSCWVADRGNNQVVHLGTDGSELWRGGGFNAPSSVSVDPGDGSCWVADTSNNQIVHLDSSGSELWRGGGFNRPLWVSVDSSDGSCWVADRSNNQVVHLDSDGNEMWRGGGFNLPSCVAANPSDRSCWVADTGNSQVVHLASDGTELWRGGGFSSPWGVAVNTADDSCWVSDTGNGQVVHLAVAGTELWRGGTYTLAYALDVDSGDGSCWIADYAEGSITHLGLVYTLGLDATNGSIEVDGVPQSLPWSDDYVNGTEVVLEAIPDSTYEFTSWSGDLSGSENPTTVTVDSDTSISANFSKIYYTLTINGSGSGSVYVDGVEKTLPWSDSIAAGTSVALEAAPASCYEFSNWSGALTGSTNPTSITMDGAKSITANFSELQYTLSLTGSGNGSVIVDGTSRSLPWSGSFACGSTVDLEADPDSCNQFTTWSGDLTGGTNPTSITMDGAKSVTANFAPIMYTLSLTGIGVGSVSVDGVSHSLPWSGGVACGTSVELTAAPDACYTFGGWTGDLTGVANPKSLSMTGNKSVTATFNLLSYDLEISGIGDGSVSVDGVVRSLPWTGTFDCGDTVTLEAVPDSCWQFGNWSGDLTGSDSPDQIVIDGDKNVTANFEQIEYSLSIDGTGSGSILVDGTPHSLPWSGTYTCGSAVTVAAVPSSCYQFDSWSGDLSGSVNPRVITMSAAKLITANFSMIQYTLQINADGNGAVTVDGEEHSLPWSGLVDCGSVVTLDAVPDSCYEFSGWTGAITWASAPVDIVMDGDKNLTASFSQVERALSIDGLGGSVIVDGTPQTLPWSGAFLCGETVSLEAVPDEHREFAGWSGDLASSDNPTSIVIDGDKSVTASFGYASYTISVSAAGDGSVLVDGTPVELPWAQPYVYGTSVVLTAVPGQGAKFSGWSGAISSSEAVVSVEIMGPTSVTAVFEPLVDFSDIEGDHWAIAAIAACIDAGIVFGYDDGLYRPELKVSRAAMAVYIARGIAGGQENVPAGPEEPTFPDVGVDHWAYDGIEYAVAANVVTGYGDGSYQPSWTVTRAQMAVFVARAIVDPTGEEGLSDYTPPAEPTFTDVPTTYWCFAHVEYLAENNIVSGYADGYYRPTSEVTRDQMAIYISRAFGLLSE